MEAKPMGEKRACVVGGSGYLASTLIKLLLQRGYAVNTTVRDPDNQRKVSHLVALQTLGNLKIFQADLCNEKSFDTPVAGCDLVFHVATPINFVSEDPENDMIKPAIQGVENVLKACVKAGVVKRVILTSSAAAVTIDGVDDMGLVKDESHWTDVEFLTSAKPPSSGHAVSKTLAENHSTDVEFLTSEKPPTWGYAVSKTLAEKAAWKFAKENNIDLVTIIPTLLVGPALTLETPSSIGLAMSFITGNKFLINGMKGMQMFSGSISLTHVEDVCRAHILVGEKESASGRYICCAVNTSVPELTKFLKNRYPEYNISTEFEDIPSKSKLSLSSEKLIKEGFSFKYGIEEIYDQSVSYFKAKGLLV